MKVIDVCNKFTFYVLSKLTNSYCDESNGRIKIKLQ